MLRTGILARLLLERLGSLGPASEPEAVAWIELRAPGRGPEVVLWARQAGMVRRVVHGDDEPATLEALSPVLERAA